MKKAVSDVISGHGAIPELVVTVIGTKSTHRINEMPGDTMKVEYKNVNYNVSVSEVDTRENNLGLNTSPRISNIRSGT